MSPSQIILVVTISLFSVAVLVMSIGFAYAAYREWKSEDSLFYVFFSVMFLLLALCLASVTLKEAGL